MRLLLILIVGFLFELTTLAQQTGPNFYLIHFRDKGFNKSMLNDPGQFLSAKAVDRRMRHNIQVDESDLPLNENYVRAVVSAGAHIVARSRWFNYVVAECNAADKSVLESLPGVATVMQLDNRKRPANEWPSSKPFFANESYAPFAEVLRKSPEGDV